VKVIITGGAGFIGKWLISMLPPSAEIVVIDNLNPDAHRSNPGFAPEVASRATCLQLNVCDVAAYQPILEGADVVVHLAAATGTGQSFTEIGNYVRDNVEGTARLLEGIAKLSRKPRRIVLASSRAVYGEGRYTDGTKSVSVPPREIADLQKGIWDYLGANRVPMKPLAAKESDPTAPVSVYGFTKLWQEQLIRNFCGHHKIEPIIFRMQNVYGPKQEIYNPYTGIVALFVRLIASGQSVELYEDGKVLRDFVYVEDVARAFSRAVLEESLKGCTVNIGSGEAKTLEELVATIAVALKQTPKILYSKKFRPGDVRHAFADISAARAYFGDYQATSALAGLQKYCDWFQSSAVGTAVTDQKKRVA